MAFGSWWTGVVALSLLGLSACGAPIFPKELFTVSGQGADYPVMMSRAPAPRGGRPISAQSGTHASQSQATYGNVTVTTTMTGQSELSASTKLHAQINRADKWIQIEKSTFSAVDFSTYGASSSNLNLQVEGTAHR
jgi:hypothetical protein